MSAADTSTYIPEFASLVLYCRAEVAVVAFLVYEYVITLDQELALFWRRKKTGATCLFLANRYLTLLCFAWLGSATFATMSDQKLQVVQYTITSFQYLPTAVFSGLRALALSGMNWPLGVCVSVLAASPFFGSMWELSLGITGSNQPPFGCGGGNNTTPRQQLIRERSACIITADIIVIIVTWWYSFKTHGTFTTRRDGTRSHLADILSINGEWTIYFLLFMVLNTVQLAFNLVSSVYALENIGVVISFVAPLQAVMTCRFMIALQSADRRVVGGGAASGANADGQDTGADGVHTLRFASRVVGSIGGDIGASYLGTADEYDEDQVDDEDVPEGVPECLAQEQLEAYAEDRGSACSGAKDHNPRSHVDVLEV
ncbi:uncharacterized protein TRAVEDRAFT_47256 [Trametes versicolor FP-101664 SS1]|uniref:uncharacterized protein n=1 Tax=Trametes versicolor (strain FP-101664) TaxID=717944 RepID=UPI0004621547|nr:uncharacterized protein TRAVEDRAFT_47256 [Trametes versicolor FP-101664 SS1]EIW59960.1 hypothetical protein TRAVEDRAFT_47256 [Trametes versicolor FP-101664 SS1]